MQNIIKFDFRGSRNRNVVLQLIADELYPVKEFPRNLFPDLPAVLFKRFTEVLHTRKDLRESYQHTTDKEPIETMARDILVFRNLLDSSPQTVVLLYRTYIKKFIKYKHNNADEWEDIFQEVITRLIAGKIQRIREKFDFSYQYRDFSQKSFFTSYLMVSVRNIYMDILRERRVRPLTSGEIQPMDESIDIYEDEHMLDRLVIDEEFHKLETVLSLYYKSRPRLELCLKLKCRVPLTGTDIRECFPSCSPVDVKILDQDFKNTKDKKLFDTVVPVFNRYEGTENKSDTLRKWVSIKVDEVTSHLNHTHGIDVYNSKNVVDFITLYYERFNLVETGAKGNPGQFDQEVDHG